MLSNLKRGFRVQHLFDMTTEKNRPAPSKNEPSEIMTFQFSESKSEMQTTFYKDEPWIVATDICNVLGLGNTTNALRFLDEDEKLPLLLVRAGQTRKVNCVNESGLYNLIFKSRKPEAKVFRKWVTSEVLPAIRKKGNYSLTKKQTNFTDARSLPFEKKEFNKIGVRCVAIEGKEYFSVSDINNAIHSRTCAAQTAKKLNVVQPLAQKIWLFGATHPAWFTCILGFKLIVSGSRVFNSTNQLILEL